MAPWSNENAPILPRKDAVIVVDPFSTGMCLVDSLLQRGYACVSVISDTEEAMKDWMDTLPIVWRKNFIGEFFHDAKDHSEEGLQKLLHGIRALRYNVIGVIAGAEPGVKLTDLLSERMGLTTNGSAGSEGRRNKYVMGEKIRAAKLRAVKQCLATSWKQAKKYITNTLKPEPFKVIVKPVDSAGSDDVTLCKSMNEVKKAFRQAMGKINHLGIENQSLLVQEYLQGTEYVVDTVSRNGVHKVVAVWEYDKREANGAAFVYYGAILREAQGDVILPIVNYIFKVLGKSDACNK